MSKTIVGINASNFGCTGRINIGIMKQADLNGYKTYTVCSKGRSTVKNKYENQIFIKGGVYKYIRTKIEYYSGYQNIGSYFSTKELLRKLDYIKPNLFHFHIMHTSFVNIKLLIDYANKNDIPIVWTMHDCWAFTGQCPYFDNVGCEKWKTGCMQCPQLYRYPASKWFDHSKENYERKKRIFTSIKKLEIVCPSQWLSDLVKKSFFKGYNVSTIHNGIDTNSFYPQKSDLKKEYGVEDKFIVLGVAGSWEKRKGVEYFKKLAKENLKGVQIVMIGVSEEMSSSLPDNIIAINKTDSLQQLARWYSCADVLLNPTLEDNFPTVNIEALSCGTPIITFDTGGSPEAIDVKTGIVVPKGDYTSLKQAVEYIKQTRPFSSESCFNRAKKFEEKIAFQKYIDLYNELLKEK